MVKTTVSSDKNPSKESNNQAEKGDSTCDDSPIGEDSKKPSVTSEKLLTPGSPMESLRRRHMTSNQSYHVTHSSGQRGQAPSGGGPIRSPGTNQNVAIN